MGSGSLDERSELRRDPEELRAILENGIQSLGGTDRFDLARAVDDLVHLALAAAISDTGSGFSGDRTVAYIEWVDAGVAASRWDGREATLERAAEMIGAPIRSAGLLVAQELEYVVLALGRNDTADDLALSMVIPRACIRRMEIWPAIPSKESPDA